MAAMRAGGCVVCGRPDGLQAHHALPRQAQRRLGLDEADPLNAVPLCARCHGLHHSRHRPVRISELPPQVYAYLVEHAGRDWVHRFYS